MSLNFPSNLIYLMNSKRNYCLPNGHNGRPLYGRHRKTIHSKRLTFSTAIIPNMATIIIIIVKKDTEDRGLYSKCFEIAFAQQQRSNA